MCLSSVVYLACTLRYEPNKSVQEEQSEWDSVMEWLHLFKRRDPISTERDVYFLVKMWLIVATQQRIKDVRVKSRTFPKSFFLWGKDLIHSWLRFVLQISTCTSTESASILIYCRFYVKQNIKHDIHHRWTLIDSELIFKNKNLRVKPLS